LNAKSKTTRKEGANADLDAVIRRKYVEFGVAADSVLSFSEESEKFAKAVNSELPNDAKVDSDAIRWRLITLRKRGEEKGGLPRIERAYNGRKHRPKPKPR
jgi:hypothetical protein